MGHYRAKTKLNLVCIMLKVNLPWIEARFTSVSS